MNWILLLLAAYPACMYSIHLLCELWFRCSHLLTERKWSESEVTQSCPTLCNPMNCSLPGFSVHGIFQARVLEWVAISFSRGSSQTRDRTRVSHTAGRHFTIWATREAHFLLKLGTKRTVDISSPPQMMPDHIKDNCITLTSDLLKNDMWPDLYQWNKRFPQSLWLSSF